MGTGVGFIDGRRGKLRHHLPAQVRIPSTVTLVAKADIGSGFAGWTGAYDTQGTDPVCNVEVNLATTVTAKFDKRLYARTTSAGKTRCPPA